MTEQLVTLANKTIVVTGGARGIGAAITRQAIQLGGNVVAVDLDAAGLAELKESVPEAQLMTVTGSVTDEALARDTVAAAVERFGGVEGLVNNAGIIRPALIEKMTSTQWREVIDVHLTGSFFWTQAVGRHMVERAKAGDVRDRAIVNISSDAARKGSFGQINYSAAKAGLMAMSMSVAREWSRYRIRANSVCFGAVETEMTETVRSERFLAGLLAQIPLGYCATPQQVVKSVCFLLSDASSYTTGQHLGVNGGFHISM